MTQQQYIRVRDGAVVDDAEALDHNACVKSGYGLRVPQRMMDGVTLRRKQLYDPQGREAGSETFEYDEDQTGDSSSFRRLTDAELAAHRPGWRTGPVEDGTGSVADVAAHLRRTRDLRERAYADYQTDLVGRYKDADPLSIVGTGEQAGAASGGPVGSACMVTSYLYKDQFGEPGTLQPGTDDSGRPGLVCVPTSLNDASPRERAYRDYETSITTAWMGDKKRRPDPDDDEDEIEAAVRTMQTNTETAVRTDSGRQDSVGLQQQMRDHKAKMATIYADLDRAAQEQWRS